MGGTIEGGQQARDTNIIRYGEDYYSNLGKAGAREYRQRQREGIALPRGFAANRELARTAGTLGGTISRRGKAKKTMETA